MRITYTPEAIDDLKKLKKFIEVKNPLAAQRAEIFILKGISQLKEHPYLGVEVQQTPDPTMTRDLIIGNYLLAI